MIKEYTATASFKSDRILTEREINLIKSALQLQLAEPWDENQNDIDLTLGSIDITIEEKKKRFFIRPTREIAGTSLKGYVETTRNELNQVFGFPMAGDGYKTNFNYAGVIRESNGTETLVTVYDWKYEREVELEEKIGWNIGGFDYDAVQVLKEALEQIRGTEVKAWVG